MRDCLRLSLAGNLPGYEALDRCQMDRGPTCMCEDDGDSDGEVDTQAASGHVGARAALLAEAELWADGLFAGDCVASVAGEDHDLMDVDGGDDERVS